jgi:pimeloyl-ACP methyl ester carboxylesterase
MFRPSALLTLMAVCCCALATPVLGADDAPIDRFLGDDGERLYYAVEGTGCPVLFVGGGSAMDSRQWEEASRAIGDEVMAIRFDPRGIGRSDTAKASFTEADDIASVLDELGLARAVVVGNSSAGGLALEFALAYPDRVQGVVAVSPFIDGWKFSKAMQQRVDRLAVAFASGAEQFVEAIFFDSYFIPAPRNPSGRGRARKLIEEGYDKLTSGDPSLGRTSKTPLLERVGDVTAPVLLVVGKLDHPDLHRRVAFLDQTFSDSHVFEVNHSGHTPTLEAPATLARGIREFLGSLNWDSRKACRDAVGRD